MPVQGIVPPMLWLLLAFVLAFASPAAAACVDLNAAPLEELRRIIHVDEDRAGQIVNGRPWPNVRAVTRVRGIGQARLRGIEAQGVACVESAASADMRETIDGLARVLDGDTLELAGERVRLIGIDAPEGRQLCQRGDREWACGDDAAAALDEMIAGMEVRCDVLGRDRWGRALALCFADGVELNREMVREGWALAWYPERGAVPGPAYDAEQANAEAAQRGLWSGSFIEPWEWRRRERGQGGTRP